MAVVEVESDTQAHKRAESWSLVRLGDVCNAINGRAFKSTEWRDSGLPIIRIQNLKDPRAKFNCFDGELDERHRVHTGDLLFAWSGTPGTSFGAHIWKGPVAALNQHIFNIKFDRENLDPRYFCLALNQNVSRYVAQAQGGVGLAHITKAKFLDSLIPFASMTKQLALVAEIEKQFSRLDEAVRNLKRVKANLKRYKRCVLKAAVEGYLVPLEAELAGREGRSFESGTELLARLLETRRNGWSGKGKYREPEPANAGALPELPAGWAWASVEELSTKVTDGVHKKPNYVPQGIPFVTVRNLTAGSGISFDQLNYVTAEDHALFCQRTNPEKDDILISKDGTLGVVRRVETDQQFSVFVSVALVKPVARDLSRYLLAAFESPLLQRQMVPKGSGLQHIHLEDLRRDCVPLPPQSEQLRICDEVDRRLTLIGKVDGELDRHLLRAKRIRDAILSRGFSTDDAVD